MEIHEDGDLRLVKVGPLGAFGNNVYLIQDRQSQDAIVVDAPSDAEQVLEALGEGRVTRIVVTHRHPDQLPSKNRMIPPDVNYSQLVSLPFIVICPVLSDTVRA